MAKTEKESAIESLEDLGQTVWCLICDAVNEFSRHERGQMPNVIHVTPLLEQAILARWQKYSVPPKSARELTVILGMKPVWDAEEFRLEYVEPEIEHAAPAESAPFEIEVPVPAGDHDIVLRFPNQRELIVQLRPSNADVGYNGSLDIVLDREELLTCWAGDDMEASVAPDPSRQHERYIKQIVMQLPYDPRNPEASSGPHVLESKIYDVLRDYPVNMVASDLIEKLVAEVLKADNRRSDA